MVVFMERVRTAQAMGTVSRLGRDARHYQLVVLGSLLVIGVALFEFPVSAAGLVLVFAAALLTQYLGDVCLRGVAPGAVDIRSALITGLSLTLLLRANSESLWTMWPLAGAAVVAIGSKFLIRFRGKHVFNPANIGIVAMILVTDSAWTTPGQWGPLLLGAFAFAGAGMFVTYRAARFDVPLLFLGSYAALLFGRALWLGDPMTIPLHNLQSGAILLFAFFMISDPKTTPDSFAGRAIFCAGTALIAYVLQYHLFIVDGLFYALAIACVLRPLIDLSLPAMTYQWPGLSSPNLSRGDPYDRPHQIIPS